MQGKTVERWWFISLSLDYAKLKKEARGGWGGGRQEGDGQAYGVVGADG